MDVSTRVTHRYAIPRAALFDLATSNETLVRTFVGAGPIPAILEAELLTPGPLRAGSIRRIKNSDGSVIDEQVTTLDAPHRHTYRLPGGFAFPFNLMVKEALGDWQFSDADGGSEIAWSYRFTLTTPLVAPLVAPILKIFFRRAMARCLDGIAKVARA